MSFIAHNKFLYGFNTAIFFTCSNNDINQYSQLIQTTLTNFIIINSQTQSPKDILKLKAMILS